jgi:hypothetical protein
MTVAELNRRRSRRLALLNARSRAHIKFDALWLNNYMTRIANFANDTDALKALCSKSSTGKPMPKLSSAIVFADLARDIEALLGGGEK